MTRPEPDSSQLATELKKIGFRVTQYPLLTITPCNLTSKELASLKVDMEQAAALLFTSANGVRALSGYEFRLDCPSFAVGEATAIAAQDAGFRNVYTAKGDIQGLAATVRSQMSPSPVPLLHIAGTHRAGNLAALLSDFEIRRHVLYTATARTCLDAPILEMLRSDNAAHCIDCIPLYSPRTAKILTHLFQAENIEAHAANICIVAMSLAVAHEVRSLNWKDVTIASAATGAAMLNALEHKKCDFL